MSDFKFAPRGEKGHTDAEVELLIQQHEKHMVATEIGPLKTQLKEATKTAAEKEATHATELQEANDKLAKLEEEKVTLEGKLQPYETADRNAAREKAIAEAKLIAANKLTDAMKLAGVTDEDDNDTVIAKLTEFAETEGREDYKFVEKGEDDTPPPANPTPAEVAAISAKGGTVKTGTEEPAPQMQGELPNF